MPREYDVLRISLLREARRSEAPKSDFFSVRETQKETHLLVFHLPSRSTMQPMDADRPHSSNGQRLHSSSVESGLMSLVPLWCSIRLAVAFVGFLGMIAHYSQKINVGIALVCMVNHSAIDQHGDSIVRSLTQVDIDCPRSNGSDSAVSIEAEIDVVIIAVSHVFAV